MNDVHVTNILAVTSSRPGFSASASGKPQCIRVSFNLTMFCDHLISF